MSAVFILEDDIILSRVHSHNFTLSFVNNITPVPGLTTATFTETFTFGSQGQHRGDWSFPDGTILPFSGTSVPIGLARTAQIAVIRRTTATGPTGIYRCRIATNAVHSDTNESVGETGYVGLYAGSEGMSVKM